MILVMLRGRYRILPAALDRAVLLPGQGLMEKLDRELMIKGDREGKISPELEAKIRAKGRGKQAETQEGKLDPEDEEDDSGL